MLVVQAVTELSLGAKSMFQSGWCIKADVGKERRSKAGAWSRRWQNDVSAGRNAASGGVAAGLMDSGGVGVALPCASAKHSRLFPEVFLMTARMLVAGSLLV